VFEEMAFSDRYLLPEDIGWVLYFVTAMQGESKKIVYTSFTRNLRRKFASHKKKLEFEFLDMMGCQVNISWTVFPAEIEPKEVESLCNFYIVGLKPKLNSYSNTFAGIQAERLKKQVENWEQLGTDREGVIEKIWQAGKEFLIANSLYYR
jgi:hypothetical protein